MLNRSNVVSSSIDFDCCWRSGGTDVAARQRSPVTTTGSATRPQTATCTYDISTSLALLLRAKSRDAPPPSRRIYRTRPNTRHGSMCSTFNAVTGDTMLSTRRCAPLLIYIVASAENFKTRAKTALRRSHRSRLGFVDERSLRNRWRLMVDLRTNVRLWS